MQLTRVILPDNSVVETFSQTQRQLIVNQNPAPLSANHVVGSTGQPFVQLQQNSMTIATNGAIDLVGAQIELPMDPTMLQQAGNITPDNTFVAKLSPDKQAWMVMEGIKSVNTTDNTVRIVKMTNIDGEYMAIGRMTVETSNVLSPFGQNVNVTGSGIQEIEFNDGFRMSIKATQQMSVSTNVINGVSTSMTSQVGTPINNYRYLVTTNLGGVQPNLNQVQAVVQLPLNTDRVMQMATAMGVEANGAITLGVAQRSILLNPGGATNLQPNKVKRQDQTPTQNNPVATQLLLSPTFTPIAARAAIDQVNGRIAIPINNINGEFIVTMTKATGQTAPQPAVAAEPGINGTTTTGEVGGAGVAEPAGSVTMSMSELRSMMERQANGGVFLAEAMFSGGSSQGTAAAASGIKISTRRNKVQGPTKPLPFVG
ncbi:hypothetical protein ONS95_005817 [Cadophora gregata]|uniref:uncharacterized protein n=1 Tax=Cadophora gregata TaxID=51156 RepID=UPI0026DCACDF|nr:uncharacterized protein ONS95_005817 [Cadophora gregata]KAK0103818.1 hypothetical protein ONS95_005817 [Cadophora gregata]KAK0108003.1 hypothetical protein ONS96_003782 [Cadophora gregata f. sp. sojae]